MDDQYTPMKKPSRLKPGDTIGIVAPAGPFDPDLFQKGVAALEDMGYGVFQPDGLDKRNRFLAGPDEHRADLINQMFADPDINAIFCARGGYGSQRILDSIDYEVIRENSKIFIGFSDITVLLSALNNHCGLVTFHGPVLTKLGEGNPESVAGLGAALAIDTPVQIRASKNRVVRSGSCEGTVAGGNLATLCHMVGTPHMPEFGNCILILEDVSESLYKIDRMLYQMRMAGCFQGITGLALGSFTDCGELGGVLDVVMDNFQETEIPILAGFDIGHGPVNLTIPMGIPAVLDTDLRTLSYTEAAVV